MEFGNTPAAHVAADLLDAYGDASDIGRLRAFEKTYRRTRRSGLGRSLARRLSPPLEVNDLGRGSIRLGSRSTPINQIRRKPAALLMYLVTRPNFTATREQVLEDLWPDGDPESGSNSLNQSLHFLRRELDPWYDSTSGTTMWSLKPNSSGSTTNWRTSRARVLSRARTLDVANAESHELLTLIHSYSGQFCPEFEYDEWAIAWRSRVHAAYLDLAHRTIRALVGGQTSQRPRAWRVRS